MDRNVPLFGDFSGLTSGSLSAILDMSDGEGHKVAPGLMDHPIDK